MRKNLVLVFLNLLVGSGAIFAQSSSFDSSWFTVDGGGATSSGNGFALSGTIGQPDAGTMSGGGFTLQGGFWATDSPVPPGPVQPPSGRVSWWTADGHTKDVAGHNDGTFSGDPGFLSGEVDQGFRFTGPNDGFVASANGLPVGNANRTIELWVRIDAFPTEEALFAAYGAFGDFGRLFGLGATSSNPFDLTQHCLFFSSWGPAVFGPPMQTNTWYHVAVANAGNSVTLYLNGIAVGTADLTIDTAAGTSFYLGKPPAPFDSIRRLQGTVDEVAIYNRALSASEIRGIYDAGSFGKVKAPIIITAPVSQTAVAGGSANLTATASGSGPFTYQWRRNEIPLSNGTNATLALSNLQSSQSGDYTVVISSPQGAVTNYPPAIIAATPATAFDFRFVGRVLSVEDPNHMLDGSILANALISGDYTFDPATADSNSDSTIGDYLHTNAGYGIRVQAGNYAFHTDFTSVNFLVEVANRSRDTYLLRSSSNRPIGNLRIDQIAWQLDDPSGAALASDSLPLSPPQLPAWQQGTGLTISGGNLSDPVGLGGGFVVRALVDSVFVIYPSVLPPVIVIPPTNRVVRVGDNVPLSVTVSSDGPVSYQWQFNDTNIPGATSATLSLNTVQFSQAGNYRVLVSNVGGSVSATAKLEVGQPPTFVSQPASRTVPAGTNVTFTVVANGSAPLAYQWRRNGTNLFGEINATLALTSVQPIQAGAYTVEVRNTFGSILSSNATLIVQGPPFIVLQPQNQNVMLGSNGVFTIIAGGPGPLTYQWQKITDTQTNNLSGATSSILTLTKVQTASQGKYRVIVRNSFGSLASAIAVLSINVPPFITTQPKTQTAVAGTNVTLSVSADGSAPLGFQWLKDNAPVSAATRVTLVLSNIQPAQAGKYTVVVTNAFGSVVSSIAQITVLVPPTITMQPQSQTNLIGSTITFTVAAAGTSPLKYQWRLNGANISAATLTNLVLKNVQPGQAGNYSVRVSNAAGEATSANAALVVRVPPRIVAQPQARTVLTGTNVTFTVAAAGDPTLIYQWRKNGTNISGATRTNLALSNAQPADAGLYSVLVSNPYGRTNSALAELKVNIPITITQQPQDQIALAGGIVTFRVSATGTAPLSYQWLRDGKAISGATRSTLTLGNVKVGDTGNYSVAVSNAAGSVNSLVARLTVNDPPNIATQPRSQTALAGAAVAFNVVAKGSGILTYQWYKDGDPVIAATNSTLALANVTSPNEGFYWVTVRNAFGEATSGAATLTVNEPPVILSQPQNQSIPLSDTALFAVVARGNAPLTYQWRKDGSNLPGATAPLLVLTNIQSSSTGAYSVVVKNSFGSATSANAVLTLAVPPVITVQPLSRTVPAGTDVTFTVTATGSGPLSYQWQKSAADIPGATAATLTLTNAQTAQAGDYAVVVSNLAGSANSLVATLTVNAPETVYTFTTIAGRANIGTADGAGAAARFNGVAGVAIDSAGNIYVADRDNHTIRKVTSSGSATTFAGLAGTAGSLDGTGPTARFNRPYGIATDANDNIYVTDAGNQTIRKITPTGQVTTLAGSPGIAGSADGTGSAVRFSNALGGIAVATDGAIYVADELNYTIRKITASGVVTTFAGSPGLSGSADGAGTVARFNGPKGIAVDSAGNLYVTVQSNHTIRKISAAGTVSTLAGSPGVLGFDDGTASAARFDYPEGIAVDSAGNVYVTTESEVRKITSGGGVTTLAGSQYGNLSGQDGTSTAARFYRPAGIAVDAAGVLYVADAVTIRRVTQAGVVTTLAGSVDSAGYADGVGTVARFFLPENLAIDSAGNLYVADYFGERIRKITPAGVVSTFAGMAGENFQGPSGLALDSLSNVYVADFRNNTIRRISPAGLTTTFAGLAGSSGSSDGSGSSARFNGPSGIAIDRDDTIYVADQNNNTIRRITPDGTVHTFAGLAGSSGTADGMGDLARFNGPTGIALDSAGNLYVADQFNGRIRKIAPNGLVSTLAGSIVNSPNVDGQGSATGFSQPTGIAIGLTGDIFVTDNFHQTIRKITPDGFVTTVGGLAQQVGSSDGTGSTARFNDPSGVAVDAAGNLYIADSQNNTIRKGVPSPITTQGLAGSSHSSALAPLARNRSFRLEVRLPSEAQALRSLRDDGVFRISIPTSIGQSYVLESTDSLNEVDWKRVTTVAGDGNSKELTDSDAASSQRFYRVRIEQTSK